MHFDVSVLDRGRRPVRGLTAADFTVLEDGKPQAISAFASIDVPPAPPPPTASWLRDVPRDVHTNEFEELPDGRLLVIVIDDGLIPAEPQALQSAKKIARGIVDRAGPRDRIAIVYTYASKHAQDFTTERSHLYAAIDALAAGPANHLLGWDSAVPVNPRDPDSPGVPMVDADAQWRAGTLRTLQLSAESLVAAPQRRKALFFISPGVSVDLEGDARPVLARGAGSAQTMSMVQANRDAVVRMKDVFRRLAAANVSFYSVDPCGVDGLHNYVANAARSLRALRSAKAPLPGDFNWLAPNGAGVPRPLDLAQRKSTLDREFLLAAAENTGGRAIINTNDFEPGLDAIFGENSSYYLLGYPRGAPRPAGYLHRVTVKVNRPDVLVRVRSGYEADSSPDASTQVAAPTRALSVAAAGPVASSTLPLQLSMAAFVGPKPDGVASVAIVLGMRQPPVTDRTPQTLRVQTSVYTPDGAAVDAPRMTTASLIVLPGKEDIVYEVLTARALKPGRYTVRVSAHRESDGLAGSVYGDVTVPDFARTPIAVSGALMHVDPGMTSVPREGLSSLLPFRPTAAREFSQGDDARVYFRVYQNGREPIADVPLAVRIVDERDETVASATGTVPADRFDTEKRTADHFFRLPTSALAPGRYLLRFDFGPAADAIRRDVVIRMK